MLETEGAAVLGFFFLVAKLILAWELLLTPIIFTSPPPLFMVRPVLLFFFGLLESEWLVPERETDIYIYSQDSRQPKLSNSVNSSLLAFDEAESVGEISGKSSHCRQLSKACPLGMSKPSPPTSAAGSVGLSHTQKDKTQTTIQWTNTQKI